MSKDALEKAGYPGKPGGDFYLVFDVERADEFDALTWNYSKLRDRLGGRLSGWPYAVRLDSILVTAL